MNKYVYFVCQIAWGILFLIYVHFITDKSLYFFYGGMVVYLVISYLLNRTQRKKTV